MLRQLSEFESRHLSKIQHKATLATYVKEWPTHSGPPEKYTKKQLIFGGAKISRKRVSIKQRFNTISISGAVTNIYFKKQCTIFYDIMKSGYVI